MNDRLAKRRNSPALQFNLRMLFELLLLCGLLISFYQWWDGRRHLEPTRVRGADRAVILENEECVKVPRQMAVTDPAELEAIMDGFADCIRVPQFNRCMPAPTRSSYTVVGNRFSPPDLQPVVGFSTSMESSIGTTAALFATPLIRSSQATFQRSGRVPLNSARQRKPIQHPNNWR